MPGKVYLTKHAERDLEELYDFLCAHDSQAKAQKVLGKIEDVIAGLTKSPDRGNYPKELIALGIKTFREVRFKPHRLIYRVINKNVYVIVIADGRRDFTTLLQSRLLEP